MISRPSLTVPRTAVVAALIVAGMLAGCARMVPIPVAGVTVASDRYGSSQRSGDVTITVRNTGWRGQQVLRLDNYFLPVFVEIRNDGDIPVAISRKDISLVDDEGTLYSPVPPQRVERLLLDGLGHHDEVTGAQSSPVQAFDDPDVLAILSALTDVRVPSGTQVRGAVFFSSQAGWGREVVVHVQMRGQTHRFRFRVR